MSIVTDSTLRAMLEQLHAALSDDDGKGAKVWPALTADNFAEVQVGDFLSHQRYRFAVLLKTSSKIVGVGIYPTGDLEAARYEVNLVGGVLRTPVMTKLASLADLEDLKHGEYTSLTADNFAGVKVGDKVGNGIVIYKTSTNCTVYTGYQKLVQYELSGGVVTPFEMTVPEQGEVAALKAAVNGKWDKPVIYGDGNPITPTNFHSVKPGDYLYGTMCVRGSNGGTELQFSGSGTYRKVYLEDSDALEDKLMYDGKKVRHEYGVLATSAQLNALKTEVEGLKPVAYEYKSTWKEADFAKIKIGDSIKINNTSHTVETNCHIVTEVWDEIDSVGFTAVGSPRHFVEAYWDKSTGKIVLNYYTGVWNWANPTGSQWNDIKLGDTITYGGQVVTVIYKSSSEIRAFNGLQVYVFTYQTGATKLTPAVKAIQFA